MLEVTPHCEKYKAAKGKPPPPCEGRGVVAAHRVTFAQSHESPSSISLLHGKQVK